MTIIKSIPLREFSVKALLPKDNTLVDNRNAWKPPIEYLAKLREFKFNKKPLRFIIFRPQQDGSDIFDTNLLVTLEEYTVTENACEEGDFYVDIKMKEYVSIQSKKLVINNTNKNGNIQAKQESQRPTKDSQKTYTVKKGDTLWVIAQKYLGSGDKWKQIADLNGITNPRNLQIGKVLKLQ